MAINKTLEIVEIEREDASVKISLYGATITSWKYRGKEKLFCSKKAVLDGSKAIRGIPIVFPQFGPIGPLPQHGFARVSTWKLDATTENESETMANFVLTRDAIPEAQRSLWGFNFKLVYSVIVASNTLTTKLTIVNQDSVDFDFTTLLHTYDITTTKVLGLQGLEIIDGVSKTTSKETRHAVTIDQEVDRIYTGTRDVVTVDHMVITKQNFPDVVVWNPWIEKAQKLADFDDDEYKEMICVEVGSVDKKVTLKPGEIWTGSQTLVAISH